MGDQEKFNKKSLPKKEYFHLNMEDINDAGYANAKRVCKDFEKKNWEYHDLYVQGNTLLLAIIVVVIYLRTLEKCVSKYMSLILQNFFSSWISRASSFKKDQRKIRSFNWYR